MNTFAEDAPRTAAPPGHSTFADRWIWVFMSSLFITAALAGFVPSSLERLQLIEQGKQQPFPLTTHLHAVTMASWLALTLLQALLMATARPSLHRALGLAAVVLGPLVAGSLATTTIQFLLANKNSWPLPQLSDQFAFAVFVQGKVVVLFGLYLFWALRVRTSQPQLHKRLILLTSFVVIPAAFSRIPWLPHFGLEWPYYEDLWNVLILVPVLIYDVIRFPRWLWVWLLGIGLNLPFIAAYYYIGLRVPAWWQEFVARLLGAA